MAVYLPEVVCLSWTKGNKRDQQQHKRRNFLIAPYRNRQVRSKKLDVFLHDSIGIDGNQFAKEENCF